MLLLVEGAVGVGGKRLTGFPSPRFHQDRTRMQNHRINYLEPAF